MGQNYIKILYSFLGIIICSTIFLSCATNPVTGKKEIMLITESQEIAMGLEADPGIIANFGLYDNPAMQDFINKKGKEMAAISHRPQLDFQFRILDSPVLNAFAVPGGFVYFTRGIMAHFNNEAEFVGVLGHEIGHITARHSAAQLSKQQLFTGLLIGGMVLSEDFREFSDLANTGLGLLFLKFGRDDESQSDELDVQYSTKINYNAHEMANFFDVLNRMREQSGQSIPTFMSTHPDPGDRFQKVHSLADKYQQGISTSNLKVNRDSYLKMIDGLVFGEDPRQGYVDGNVFYHPQMKFSFPVPDSWQLINTPQMVQIAHVENNAANALILFTLASETTLDAAAQTTVERDQLQVVETAKVTVNGFPAIAMISEQVQQAQNGQIPDPNNALRILTYLIQDKNLIYKFHGLTRKADFNKFYNSFSGTMTKFKRLTDPAKINVKPERIAIKTVSRNGTLDQTLQILRIPADKKEEIALLNNMHLTTTLQKGTLIKILEKK